MKHFIVCTLLIISFHANAQNLEWNTYFGPEGIILVGTELDSQGNLYIATSNSYTTLSMDGYYNHMVMGNTFQPNYSGSGSSEGILSKFSAEGDLLWSTFYGDGTEAQNYGTGFNDITIDNNDNIYTIGSTGSKFMSTLNEAPISNNEFYRYHVLVSKFNAAGQRLWSRYMGGLFEDSGVRIQYHDGFLYLSGDTYSANGIATTGSFQPTIPMQDPPHSVSYLTKMDLDGTVIWSTYYGQHDVADGISGLAIGDTGIYVVGFIIDFDGNPFYATPSCFQPQNYMGKDLFLSKFSFDGDRLWSTYIGGPGNELVSFESIATYQDVVYIADVTTTDINIATPNGFNPTKESGRNSAFIMKFNGNGEQLWGSYYGYMNPAISSFNVQNTIVQTDANGNVFLQGNTMLDNMATAGAYQESISNNPIQGSRGNDDAFVLKLTPEGVPIWGTYYGGTAKETGIKTVIGDDFFYLIGNTISTDLPTTADSFQPDYITSEAMVSRRYNGYIAKFSTVNLSVEEWNSEVFAIYPNPVENSLTIRSKELLKQITLYDVTGKLLIQKQVYGLDAQLPMAEYANGYYLLQVQTEDSRTISKKIIKK
ncbi:MAG: T9SS type A sorting domain-containing protein [Xanthomarina gelatinilytica]|uniref:T9SS type A sorting domain-containing protein n=1 Tax=Xanthomarina gelatinilytica TaxID=1137281 RepID=UPI003A87D4C4